MTNVTTNHNSELPAGLVVPAALTVTTVAASSLRAGTLIGLGPHLWIERGLTWPFMVLLMHIFGALFTVAAAVVHSRTGLLIAVLYTGYSTVMLGLDAPTSLLQILVWTVGGLTLLLVLSSAICVKDPNQHAQLSRNLLVGAVLLVIGVALTVLLHH
ncbi:hypothetical protein [Gleimia hominis]|uniref:hypothetical protein n=1 Tax=Gleimia hominis TaxID=595468 RepID=UPI000C80C842|nr:hypothetical protein [Gleimia hominis]WIK64427.1 hypothetical protein CJ187_009030 [Gleimia hominis]